MDKTANPLDELRRRIDAIDDGLHDLIMQRAELVEAIAGVKQQGQITIVRPGREALILQRLLGRHRGRFPRTALVRMWREMIGGTIAMQGEFSVAVATLGAKRDYWDLARDHYGGHVPMTAYNSVGEILRAIAEGRATLGVVPAPQEGESDPWWPLLAMGGAAGPRVLARLPYAGRGNGRGDGGSDAMVVGAADADATPDDRSWIAIECEGELSRARMTETFKAGGFAVTLSSVHQPTGSTGWHLIELDERVAMDDTRLGQTLTPLLSRVGRVMSLGYYARPIAAEPVSAASAP
jgi:chorismate mutase / prephenate dehydratase